MRLDFDASGEDAALKLFRETFDISKDHQDGRDEQCERDYQLFHAFLDMRNRDPGRSNVSIPKMFSLVMTKAPKEIKAAIGRRPYIPFEAEREEFKEYSDLQSQMLDQLLYLGGFFNEFVVADMIKTLYGTAFMESVPYYKKVVERAVVPDVVELFDGPVQVGMKVVEQEAVRLRFKLRTYAPWEIKVDPYATDLENPDGCRWLVKIMIASKREIKKLAKQGAYGPKFDAGRLDDNPDDFGQSTTDHRGLQILSNMGLPEATPDGDIGVLFRYESPDRYIDVWNDNVVLRDVDNPYSIAEGGHGLINLSRLPHNIDPHTQNRFWGNGEGKINEIMSSLMNDLINITLDNHNMANMGKTFYAMDMGMSPEKLVHQIGNKIGIKLPTGMRIDDVVKESWGNGLPADHYNLQQMAEDWVDMTSGSHEVARGEESTGQRTLGEVAMLKESGDSRQELNVRLIEAPFLTDLGHKNLSHIQQWAQPEDISEILGDEAAQMMMLMHPQDLPGSFNFVFTGSDRVVNQLIKQQNLATVSEALANNPYTKLRGLAEVQLETHDLGDKIDDLLISEEEKQFMDQQAAEQEMQEQEQKAEIDTQKSNSQIQAQSQAKMAQEQGRAASPAQNA